MAVAVATAALCLGVTAIAQAQVLDDPLPPSGPPAIPEPLPADPGQEHDVDLEVDQYNLEPVRSAGAEAFAQTGDALNPKLNAAVPRAAIPNPQPTDAWQLIAGAAWPDPRSEIANDPATGAIAKSPTRADTRFHTVRFLNTKNGLAAGTECAQAPDPPAPNEDHAAFIARAKLCEDLDDTTSARVPVVYRYTDTPTDGPLWERVALPGGSAPGYVGAVAWIGNTGRAVAVGGTGIYPERELGPSESDQLGRENDCGLTDPTQHCMPTDPRKADVAGAGRAWLLDGSSWQELSVPQQPPGETEQIGMRGMTALDFWPDTSKGELGWAGGLGQLWKWEGGPDGEDAGFTKRLDAESPPDTGIDQDPDTELFEPGGFRYRVREIRAFVSDQKTNRRFYAVTSGCCAESRSENLPRLLVRFDTGGNAGRWYVRDFNVDPRQDDSQGLRSLFGREARDQNLRPDQLDSFYALQVTQSKGTFVSALTSPGGPERPREPGSIVTEASNDIHQKGEVNFLQVVLALGLGAQTPRTEIKNMSLSSARLVAADGDSDRDARPDLAAGVLRASGRALVVSTQRSAKPPSTEAVANNCLTRSAFDAPSWVNCHQVNVVDGNPPAFDEDKLDASTRSRYYLLPAYGLNAIDVVGDSGVTWAVGDGGAILRTGGEDLKLATAAEPPPPPLPPARPRELAERSPYDPARPTGASEAGELAALAEQPTESLSEPRFEPGGWPDPKRGPRERQEAISEIVISRDGAEGWAIGPVANGPFGAQFDGYDRTYQATLYHYDGQGWTRCDPEGVPGRLAADPACASLSPLLDYTDAGENVRPVKLVAAARVPYESDADPTNDDEFEVVAIGSGYRGPGEDKERCTVLRYRGGTWELDRDARAELAFDCGDAAGVLRDLAFATPSEGWLLTTSKLYRYDGEHWLDCAATDPETFEPVNTATCGNQGGRLPNMSSIAGIATAGERAYLYGYRPGGPERQLRFPLVLYRDPGQPWRADAGGLDPGFDPNGAGNAPDPEASEEGEIEHLAVARGPGGYEAGRRATSAASSPRRSRRCFAWTPAKTRTKKPDRPSGAPGTPRAPRPRSPSPAAR